MIEFNDFKHTYPWCIAVLKNDKKLVHICGYNYEPNSEDVVNLHYELSHDKEFGLIGDALNFQLTYYILLTEKVEF